MKVRIEEADFVVTMEHIDSESNYRFGKYTPDIITIMEDYIVPCLVSFGFQVQSIYNAMGEIAGEYEAAKAEEVQDLQDDLPSDQSYADRLLTCLRDTPSITEAFGEGEKGSGDSETGVPGQ